MIDIRKLKELVRLMVENDLTELDLRDSEEQVTMRRNNLNAMPTIIAPQHAMHAPAGHSAVAPPPQAIPSASASSGSSASAPADEAGLIRIESPMVGTFYAQANPDTPPFVSVGASISADKTVCIIEAMKIFNEIKAEVSGTIAKILVKNGEPVEFGQPLFLVKPG